MFIARDVYDSIEYQQSNAPFGKSYCAAAGLQDTPMSRTKRKHKVMQHSCKSFAGMCSLSLLLHDTV